MINGTVVFSFGANIDPIIGSKDTPFLGMRDGWTEIGVILKTYPECGVNWGCIWRCHSVVSCVRNHGESDCAGTSDWGKATVTCS